MTTVYFTLQSASFLLSILAICILIWVNEDISHSKRLLILLLLVVTVMNLNGLLFQNRWYLNYPQFHKILYPFSLLLAPLSFIYIRSILFHEFRFRKYDWLILLPAVLMAINLLPYYLMPISDKKAYLIQYYQDTRIRVQSSNGHLPSFVFPFVRVAWSLFFIVLNFRIIKRFTGGATSKILEDNATTLRWIKLLNLLLAILLAANLFSSVLAPVLKNDYEIPNITMSMLALVICIALYTKPRILYGLYMPVPFSQEGKQIVGKSLSIETQSISENVTAKTINRDNLSISISSSDSQNYKMLVENYFNVNKPFLQPQYSLDQLAKDLKIRRYILSALINREYNMGFREFLNRYRVAYMILHLKKSEWMNLTLEAISEECGFSSRTNFIKNFKEITGQTPSAYIKSLNKPSNNTE